MARNQLEGSELLTDGHIRRLAVDTGPPLLREAAVSDHGYSLPLSRLENAWKMDV
jgi:hypothetical protein